MTTIEVMRKALEALTCSGEPDDPGHRCGHCDDYVDRNSTVRAALRAEIERLEGVGLGTARPACVDGRCPDRRECDVARACLHHTAPIAPAIPALTDEEVRGLFEENTMQPDQEAAAVRWAYALAAERAGVRIKE